MRERPSVAAVVIDDALSAVPVVDVGREDGETFREFVAARSEETLAGPFEPGETPSDDPDMHNTKKTWHPYAGDGAMDDNRAERAGGRARIGDD